MSGPGRILIITGAAIIILGVALLFLDKIPFIGKLPGDIVIKRKNFAFYLPLGTSVLLSLLLTAVLFIVHLFKR